MKKPLYFDNAAATPLDSRVFNAMVDCLKKDGIFGNPSSKDHVYGWEAMELVDLARDKVAKAVGANPLEIVFTSGATESNNLALIGFCKAQKVKGDTRRHIITSKLEHKSVLDVCRYLETELNYKVTYITPYQDGSIDTELLGKYIDDDTFLVSLGHGNSVIGTVIDIDALASFCANKNIFFHTDCAQTPAWFKLQLENSDISLATLTPEKLAGPKGVGALFINKKQKVEVKPLIHGGGQEKGIRGGTIATHQVVGMGEAFFYADLEREANVKKMLVLREKLIAGLKNIGDVVINGSQSSFLPFLVSATILNVDGKMLLPMLRNVATATGSACSSSDLKPSYVLTALGVKDNEARATLRLSMGFDTTEAMVDECVAEIAKIVSTLRKSGDLWQIK